MKTSIHRGLALLAAIIFCTPVGAQTPAGGPKSQPLSPELKPISVEGAAATMTQVIAYSNSGKLTSKPALALLSGEAKTWQIASLGALAPAPDRLIAIDDSHAVGRTQWTGKDKQITDYYFYMVKAADGWKVEDCRSLSSIGIVSEARHKLKARKAPLTADQKYQLANMTLLLSSDAALKTWFNGNRPKLETLYKAAKSLPKPYPAAIKASDKKHPAPAKMIEQLALDSISLHDSGEAQIVIGGVGNDFVGLLYSAGGKRPPISPRAWLWVEDLGGHWYLFRHT